MKFYDVWIAFDAGGTDDYQIEALSLEAAYDAVYLGLGYDPGEVCIVEAQPETT